MYRGILLGAFTLTPTTLFAEAPCEVENTPENILALSRVAVSESGFSSPEDQGAILAVLCDVRDRARRRSGRRLSLAWAARKYSPYATGVRHPRRSRHVWVRGLNLALEKPAGWPDSRANWLRYRKMWANLLWRSQKFIEGTMAHECEEVVNHWGGSMDRYRAVRARWVLVNCGNTLNEYWRYP